MDFDVLDKKIRALKAVRRQGKIVKLRGDLAVIQGLNGVALGDRVQVFSPEPIAGEIIRIDHSEAHALLEKAALGVRVGCGVHALGPLKIAPDQTWLGRVIDPLGQPMDGMAALSEGEPRRVSGAPPDPAQRRGFGPRLSTGMAAFDTVLPLVRGQRLGLFAGSGVGKSSLLAKFARGVATDVVVIGLVGERGRELRHFTENVLGKAGMARAVVVAATSDQSPLMRRLAPLSAMAVAEYFRDQGKDVLLLIDSISRFAEAHREVALSAGETASLRGYPPSTTHAIMGLAERAGPGFLTQAGDITAVFSVLVAGSDMDEPVADILRGTLDGHVVLDRKIAERGRYPAINLLRSVSRSLPDAASEQENLLIDEMRRHTSNWERAELMIQAGLYASGSDPSIDQAIKLWPELDAFLSEDAPLGGNGASFQRLKNCLKKA